MSSHVGIGGFSRDDFDPMAVAPPEQVRASGQCPCCGAANKIRQERIHGGLVGSEVVRSCDCEEPAVKAARAEQVRSRQEQQREKDADVAASRAAGKCCAFCDQPGTTPVSWIAWDGPRQGLACSRHA